MTSSNAIVKSSVARKSVTKFSPKLEKREERTEIEILAEEQAHNILLLEAELSAMAEKVESAYEQGFNDGQISSTQEFEAIETNRLQLLKNAVHQSHEQFANQIESLEKLSLLLCRKSLEVLFNQETSFASVVEQVLSDKLNEVKGNLITVVSVSEDDFGFLNKAKSPVFEHFSPKIDINPSLSSGDVSIRFLAGTEEVSVRRNWDVYSSFIEQLGQSSEVNIDETS